MKTLLHALQLICIMIVPAATVSAQELLDPLSQTKFVNPLPIPSVIDARDGGNFTIAVTQFQQNLGIVDPVSKQPLLTTVWGYGGSYPGPTILARQNNPIDVTWENKLLNGSVPLPHLLPVDPTVEWALSGVTDWQTKGVPIVTHLHGGHTESASDGLPRAWFTPNFALKGPDFKKQTLHYDNDQEAATLWYHDHAMGITRLNVYAGLAGYYLLTDKNEERLQRMNNIPSGPYDMGLAIQDKMFTADGQLYYPSMPASVGVPKASISPEFFGDVILVNGKAWPYLEVEPRMYRFRILNGSDSRFYNLSLSTGQKFIQIGTDGGLLQKPVQKTTMLLGTGERRDVVIDFTNYSNQTITLLNDANTPYPDGDSFDPLTTGQIMQFKVTKPLNTTYPKVTLANNLRPYITELRTKLPARKLILFESTDEYGRLKVMLGTFQDGIRRYSDPVTENIQQNTTEMWEIYNETVDAHTIHLHQVQMQIVNRQGFSASVDMITGKPENVQLQGVPMAPSPDEWGWKDTYVMYPRQVTRVIANFDLAGLYVWHCHILSHEDHEMMRPFIVNGSNGRVLRKIPTDVGTETEQLYGLQTLPNPFSNTLTIRMNLKQNSPVSLIIYDAKGNTIQQVFSGNKEAGPQQFTIDGSSWSNGTYFCEVIINNQRMIRKLILQK